MEKNASSGPTVSECQWLSLQFCLFLGEFLTSCCYHQDTSFKGTPFSSNHGDLSLSTWFSHLGIIPYVWSYQVCWLDLPKVCTGGGCFNLKFFNFYFLLEYSVSDSKESACNAGDLGLIPGWKRSPGEGNGYPLQSSCLENSLNRVVWWAAVHGVTNSQTCLGDWLTQLIYSVLC